MRHFIYYSFQYLFHTRLLYSIWVCLRHLPFKQAIKVPIIFYPGSRIKMHSNAIIEIQGVLKFGQIRIGFREHNFYKEGIKMTICNDGKIVFKGHDISIFGGCNIHITPTGVLFLNDKSVLGSMGRLYCCKSIILSRGARFSHDFQIFDTNFHYLMNIETNEIKGPVSAPIVIGENCWIGNRTTINAGTKLPNECVVASNSLLNKDYVKTVPPNSILAGIPAKKVAEGFTELCDRNREAELYIEEGIVQN